MADDTTDLLADIKDQLESLEGKAETAKESQDSGGLWGWIVALVVGAAVSIGAALLIWKLNKKNEELAVLRTQVEQDEVRDAQLRHEIRVTGNRTKVSELVREEAEVHERLVTNRTALDTETARHNEAMLRVEAAQDWKQLDALNRKDR